MAWPEISIEDLPPERDDEPASLRQDILDELADHFACALNRELLKNPNQQLARERVIKQFGDPIKIARQLWFDAMKEKIMSQRIMTGVSIVMAACCIAVVGVAWALLNQSQSMNEKMLEQLMAIADQRQPVVADKVDQQILKQLEQLNQKQTVQSGPVSEELNQISFQLAEESEKEKPSIGFKGTLTRDEGGAPTYIVNAVSDKTGLLNFGKLPWGKYYLKLNAPWGESLQQFWVTTVPGRKYEERILCPANALEDVAVRFQVDWQNRPTGEDDYLLLDFRASRGYTPSNDEKVYGLSSAQIIQDRGWIYEHDLSQESGKNVYLIDVKNNRATPCALTADGRIENMDVEKLVWTPTVEILQGIYEGPTIYLIKKNELTKLAGINSMISTKTFWFQQDKYDFSDIVMPFSGLIVSPFKNLEIAPELVVDKTPTQLKQVHGFLKYAINNRYTATQNQPNVWEIKIPDLYPITRESGSLSSVP